MKLLLLLLLLLLPLSRGVEDMPRLRFDTRFSEASSMMSFRFFLEPETTDALHGF